MVEWLPSNIYEISHLWPKRETARYQHSTYAIRTDPQTPRISSHKKRSTRPKIMISRSLDLSLHSHHTLKRRLWKCRPGASDLDIYWLREAEKNLHAHDNSKDSTVPRRYKSLKNDHKGPVRWFCVKLSKTAKSKTRSSMMGWGHHGGGERIHLNAGSELLQHLLGQQGELMYDHDIAKEFLPKIFNSYLPNLNNSVPHRSNHHLCYLNISVPDLSNHHLPYLSN